MFWFGLSKKIKRIETYLEIHTQLHTKDYINLDEFNKFLLRRLSTLESEVNSLKQQLLKNQGKIEITVTDCKRL